jgi:hypothetical protein
MIRLISTMIGITFLFLLLFLLLLLQGCASKTDVPTAPCDDYGRNCAPKIKINQWTPHP